MKDGNLIRLGATNNRLRRKQLTVLVTQAVGLLALSASPIVLHAQEAGGVARVEVTGSNVRRVDSETPSPVQVISAEDLAKSGYTSVNDVLQNITSNGQGMLDTGFSGAFAAGASGISLRGLTVGATLVLIDGHRMAGYPLSDDAQRSFVDIASIPFDAVERIEVLKDGASAVYGSYAVAGVVNIILKKRFKGTTFSADYGSTQHGGGETKKMSFSHGFGSDDHYGYFALEYRHRNPILLKQREGTWNSFDWRPFGGDDIRPGSVNHVVTSPRVLTPILQVPGSASGTAANFVFLDNRCAHANWRAGGCTFENDWAQLQPETENLNLSSSFTTKIDSNWELNVKASFYNSQGRQTRVGAVVPFGSFAGNTAFGPGTGPTPGVGANAAYTVPATYPGNTLGVAANVRALLPDTGNRRVTQTDTTSTRLVADLTGNLWGWDMDVAVGHTRVETLAEYDGYLNTTELFNALNNVADPFKLGGGNSAAVMARVAPHVENKSTNSLDFIDLRANRELMQLSGGPLGLGWGASYVRKNLNQPDTVQAQNGTVQGLSTAFALGRDTVRSAYVELVAPLTKTFEVEGAVRYDDFASFGSSTTPKVGFKFTPSKAFAIRGTAAEGFRAPNAAENGISGSQFVFNNIRDPLNCPASNANGTPNTTSPLNVPAFCSFAPTYLQVSTPTLKPEESKSYTLGLILEPVRGWSTTLDFYSIEMKNQIIPMASLATFNPLAFAVRGAPQVATFGDGSTGLTPAGTIQFIAQPYVNGQSAKTTGYELGTRYKWNLGEMGKLTTGFQFAHLMSYKVTLNGVTTELAGTHGPAIIGGNTGNPRDRAQLTLSWEKGPLTATTTTNYVSGYDLTDPANGIVTCDDGLNYASTRYADTTVPGATQFCKVKSFTTTNLNLRYAVNKQLTLTGTINNLFDQEPPVDQMTYGGTGSNASSGGTGAAYNPSLHQAGAVGRFYSVGLAYKF
ncbi:MAG: TonB-dependent receptor [Rhodocyclaceae bacterium]|nr:TonB-dependent receptor [Rhodocyclaceae bacterium]